MLSTDVSSYYNFSAGGIIGKLDGGNATIKDFNIGEDNSTGNIHCAEGYENTNSLSYFGGVCGIILSHITIENCGIKNINVVGSYSGGILGYLRNTYFDINKVKLATSQNSKIEGHGYAGGVIARTDNQNAITNNMDSIVVENYLIKNIKEPNNQAAVGGLVGSSRPEKPSIMNVKNTSVTNCTIKGIDGQETFRGTGGFFGYINNVTINGYNLLINQTSIVPVNKDYWTMYCHGNVMGNNGTDCYTRIAGITISGSDLQEINVGADTRQKKVENLGTGGYIIFSDYEGTCLTDSKSETFSPITDGTNVTAYDGTAVTDNTPYVTSSPKLSISATQFLTGDGVSALAYGNSAAKAILDDIIAP